MKVDLDNSGFWSITNLVSVDLVKPPNSRMSALMNELFTESQEVANESLPIASFSMENETYVGNRTFFSSPEAEYIFDRPDVRAIFITLYTIVFCSCFFGNLMVILVVTLHWRMRSITNFCLANLAFADLCVGIFCVYQNIITYMMDSWIFGEGRFGDFMCKMYHFINSLSTTASILILVVICIERYLAIIHPMRCKQMLTLNRLRFTIVAVWILSAIISSPRFYYFSTMRMPYPDGKVEIVCLPNRLKYNSKTIDMISLVLLFVTPLLVISVLYFRIGVSLWKSSNASMSTASTSADSSSSSYRDGESNAGRSSNPYNSSLGSEYRESGRKRSFIMAMNYLRCKGGSRKRHKKSTGSFHGGDKLGYKTMNLTAMNGIGNGSSGGHGGSGNVPPSRNTNGLVISSCNGNSSLHPISSASLLQSTNRCQNHSNRNGNIGNVNSSHQHQHPCCSCTSLKKSSNGNGGSAPVSPYLKRDSSPLSSPPALTAISSTDPIVLVKFEKKSSLRKCKRNQCTIMMKSAVSSATLNSEGGGGGGNSNYDVCGSSMSSSSKNYSLCSNGSRNVNVNGAITFSTVPENYENSCSSCNEILPGGGADASMITYCQICDNNHVDVPMTCIHQNLLPGHVSVEGGCDKNIDCMLAKDSIPSSQLLIPYNTGHQCASPCPSSGTAYSNFKGISGTTKGPKRMRVVRSSKYGTRALQCRRRIIKMLIVIVFAFAVCHLPFHARKIWQYWGKGYEAGGVFSSLFTPITFLIMYAQSGINPILYAFLSHKFRNSFADLLCCNMRRSLKISRNFSVRSTNAIQLSQAGA